MEKELSSIKVNVLYGEENRSNSLKAYKAEKELKRAVIQNKDRLEQFLSLQYKLPPVFMVKKLESDERDEYSLVDVINNKLTSSTASVCLDVYKIYQEHNIETAIERLHLQSNLNIV